MLVSCLFVLIGFGLLIYGADIFVDGAANIARQLRMPPLIIGLTIVGFATSAPEIIVGTVSAWQGKTAIAIGNALGSNITNIGLVLGLSILVFPITLASETIKKEYGLMCVAIMIGLAVMIDGQLTRGDATILLISLVVSIAWIVWIAKQSSASDPIVSEFVQEFGDKQSKPDSLTKAFVKLLFGLIVLLLGADLLVRGAVSIAEFYGVPDLIIGLTIVAIGTSLPELAASIISLKKGEADIAIGNVIGSNMFNMFAVLGIPTLIKPDYFPEEVLTRDFPTMISLTLLFGAMVFVSSKGKLIRPEGAVLLFCFVAYQCLLFSQNIALT
ncbi:MAG TPA: calcium/sodium antiporter [Thiotrichaceae bacterium]|jgi:cation:H+ antiporter|nr:calcium/sodium antiporter [Thiotrichaceae bacterium]HIM07585.1 calcium/sodium antiporter [Gammaproteobacteria bacterium]